MHRYEVGEDTKEFLVGYFVRNNIELDVLRIIFSVILEEERRPNLGDLKSKSVFEFIDYNLITKLRQFGFIAEEDGFFLRYRGYIAIAYIVGVILHALHGKTYEMTELAQILYDKGFCLDGKDKIFSYHEKLVGRFLEDLTRLQLLKRDDSKYSVNEEDKRCRFACNCLSKIIDLGSLHSKSELEETIERFRSNLALEKFSIGYLMEKLPPSTLERAKSILSSSSSSDKFFLNSLKTKQEKTISEKDMLASAAYWQLSATVYEEEGNLERLDF
jgi:hypothetical protein